MSQHKLRRLRRRTSSATVSENRDNPYSSINPYVDNKFHYGRYRLRSGDAPAVQVASAYRKKIRLFADDDDDDDDEVIDSDAGGTREGDSDIFESMSMYEPCNVDGDEDAGRETEKKKRKETVNSSENENQKQQREHGNGNGTGKQMLVWKRRYDEVEVEDTDELGAWETTMSASDSVGIWKEKDGQEHRPGERDGDGTGRLGGIKTKTDYAHQSETIEDSDLDAPWEPDDDYDYYYPTWATPAPAIASYPLGKRPIRMFPPPSTAPPPSPSPPMSPLSPCPFNNDEDEEDDDEDDQDHDKDYEEDREDEEDDDEFVLPGPSRYRR